MMDNAAIAITGLDVELALSQVGIAAIQHRYGSATDATILLSAKFLRNHFQSTLDLDDELHKPPLSKPDDPVLGCLWELGVKARQGMQPIPRNQKVTLKRFMKILDKIIQGSWTKRDAAHCVRIINKLRPLT